MGLDLVAPGLLFVLGAERVGRLSPARDLGRVEALQVLGGAPGAVEPHPEERLGVLQVLLPIA